MTSKKKKQRQIGIALAIVIFGIILIQGGFLESPFATVPIDLDSAVDGCSGGFTTLSTSDVTIEPIGDRIRVTGIAKGSECLKIRLTQSGLDSILKNKGLEATRDIFGEVSLLEYTKTFPIDRIGDYKNVRDNRIISGTIFYPISSKFDTSICEKNGISNAIMVYKPFGRNIRCVIPGVNGIAGDFSSARSFGNFKVKFTIDGISKTVSREQQAVSIGSHRIEWVGNLVNLDEVSVPQFDARLISSKWDLVNDGTLSQVESKLDSFINCVFVLAGDSTYDTCKTQFDNQVIPLFQNQLENYITRNSALIHDATTDSNALYVSLSASPFPVFILDLDAQSVGIVSLEGKPDITQCISSQLDLRSGENRIVSYRVKNIGNANNIQFLSSINCNQGAIGFVSNFNILANQEKTIQGELIPSNPNQNDLDSGCTLKVTDLKSGNSDSCNFNIKVIYESGIICQPNSLTCSDDLSNLVKCTTDGKNIQLLEQCEFGCIFDSGIAKCRGKIEPPITNKCQSCDDSVKNQLFGWAVKDLKCEKTLVQKISFCTFSWFKFILVYVVLLFGTLFGKGFITNLSAIKQINKRGTRELVSWLLALTIAIGLAFLIFKLFWVGIIVFIIYTIIQVVNPF